MASFLFAYHGASRPESQEEGAKLMAKWMAWVGEMGDAMINPGTPLGDSKTVRADSVTDDDGSMNGFSVVDATSLDAAVQLAQGCPHLLMSGAWIDVSEMMDMS